MANRHWISSTKLQMELKLRLK